MNEGIYVRFTGEVVRDPVQTTSKTGTKWTRIQCNVPVHSRETGAERPTWVSIGLPGMRGEEIADIRAGDIVRVEGELRIYSYMKDGRSIMALNVTPTSVERD